MIRMEDIEEMAKEFQLYDQAIERADQMQEFRGRPEVMKMIDCAAFAVSLLQAAGASGERLVSSALLGSFVDGYNLAIRDLQKKEGGTA